MGSCLDAVAGLACLLLGMSGYPVVEQVDNLQILGMMLFLHGNGYGWMQGMTSAIAQTIDTWVDQPLFLVATATTTVDAPVGLVSSLWRAIVLGFVQGMTEFLPISSTAHLKVVPVALGWGDPGVTYTAVIQLGSIAAVLWYFWDDLTQITRGAIAAIARKDYQAQDFRLTMGIAFGTIPIVIFGLAIKIFIPDYDNSPMRWMSTIAIVSIVMALLLGLAEKIGRRKRQFDDLDTRDGILMGLAQTLALIPGVSRSGSTLTAGLFMGLERATAARFSFLLGIPAITIAGLVELQSLLENGFGEIGFLPLITAILSSALFSYLAIAGLLRYLKTRNTWVFVWYRLGFGLVILLGIAMNWISAR